jgi:DNA-binding transcriptional LysR family regulator
MINLKHLRYAVSVSRHGHFGRAAEQLEVTQSALSQGIAALERQLGVRLFDRDQGGVRTTTAGRLVLDRAETLLAGATELRREVDLLRGLDTGVLSIGAGPHAGDLFVAPALARVAAAHPGLQVRVATGYFAEIFDSVLKGAAEVGVSDIAAWRSESRLDFTSLGRHRIILACRPAHPLAGRRGVTLQDAWSYPLAAPLLTGAVAAAVPARCAAGRRDEATGHFIPAFCTESVPVALAIARSSDAIFAGPEALVRQDLDAGRLVILDVSLAAIDLEYGAYTRRGRTLSPAASQFLATLQDVLTEVG